MLMTPDDIRHAHFDSVKRGLDPDQVHDLLARVAFLLERTQNPDACTLPGPTSEPEQHALAAGASVTPQYPPSIDHDALAVQLGVVIAATQELAAWKVQLERLTGDVHAPPAAPPTIRIAGLEVAGVDDMRHRFSLRPTNAPSTQRRARA
jgi:DivIVA domain-containing protein